MISLRSLNTGEPVSNRSYDRNDPREVQWRLVDVIVKNRRFVQFQVFGKENRCL
ncbi:toxin, partial [Glaesserella parasuis]|nr:toxin [Glaesserella parasuis]